MKPVRSIIPELNKVIKNPRKTLWLFEDIINGGQINFEAAYVIAKYYESVKFLYTC